MMPTWMGLRMPGSGSPTPDTKAETYRSHTSAGGAPEAAEVGHALLAAAVVSASEACFARGGAGTGLVAMHCTIREARRSIGLAASFPGAPPCTTLVARAKVGTARTWTHVHVATLAPNTMTHSDGKDDSDGYQGEKEPTCPAARAAWRRYHCRAWVAMHH